MHVKSKEHPIMQNTIANDKLLEFVKEKEAVFAKNYKDMIKKGDTFVQYKPRHSMIFMKVNEVEHTEPMDFCIVTRHILDAKGLNVQRRFPMAAPNGEFFSFQPIQCKIHKEAVALMRDCDDKIKGSSSDSEKKSFAQKCRRKLVGLIKRNEMLNDTFGV